MSYILKDVYKGYKDYNKNNLRFLRIQLKESSIKNNLILLERLKNIGSKSYLAYFCLIGNNYSYKLYNHSNFNHFGNKLYLSCNHLVLFKYGALLKSTVNNKFV